MAKNYLDDAKIYLSGPIEHDTNNFNWRNEPRKVLTERFKLNLFDPFEDPKQQWVPKLNKARKDKKHKKIRKIARKFVHKDLSMVDDSRIVIAYLPYGVPTTGTVHEIILSNESKKPTLLVTNMDDIGYIPIWYYGFIPLRYMFPNWTALYDYLEEVNAGKHKNDSRWDLIYGKI